MLFGRVPQRQKTICGRRTVDSGMMSKIEKAKRYAEQLDRVSFEEFKVTVSGDHSSHIVSFSNGRWSCDCGFFARRGVCSHTMALERILGEMLPVPQEA
jgi:hypothetical protein